MKRKLNIKSILFSVTALVVLGAATALGAAQYGVTCDIGVYPYNPTAFPFFGAYTPNAITPQSECKSHLDYPQSSSTGKPYKPAPPLVSENPVKPGDEDMKTPWVLHEHAYFNDSGPLGPLYYYKAAVDKFEITIHPDLNKMDLGANLENLNCFAPKPAGSSIDTSDLYDCDGDSAIYGGTRVTEQKVGDKVIVTWEYGRNINSKKLVVWGNNGSGFQMTDSDGNPITADLSNPYNPYRHAEFGVNYPTDDNPEEIWATTTTSRVLIADLAIRKTHYASKGKTGCASNGDINDPNSGWCYLNPYSYNSYPKVSISKGGTPRTYFWYPIGSVASIWKKPAEDLAVCDSLDLSINQDGQIFNPANGETVTGLEPMNDMTMTVQPTFNPVSGSVPLDYEWNATKPVPPYMILTAQGEFKDSPAVPVPPSPNPFTDDDTLVYYSGGPGGTTVTVIAIDGGTEQDQCKYEFTIPDVPGGEKCDTLNVLRDGNPYSGVHSVDTPIEDLSVAVVTTPDTYAQDLHYNWTVTSGTGSMNPTPTTSDVQTTTLSGVTDGTEVTVSAFDPNDPAADVGQCEDTFSFTDIPLAGMCVDLDATLSKEPMNPGDSILVNPSVQYSGIVLPDRIRWEESGGGYFSTNSFLQLMQPWCPIPGPGSFEAPYTCRYYYNAVNIGDSFTLTAIPNPTNNDDCILTREVVDVPDEEECDYLKLYVTGGKVCIDVDPDYEGRYQWTIDGNPPFIQNNPVCQDYDEDSSYLVEGIDAENVAICSDEMEPDDQKYDCDYLNFYRDGDDLCIDVDDDYLGRFEWTFDVNSYIRPNDDLCEPFQPGIDISVEAIDTDEICEDELSPDDTPPELIKRVSKAVGGSFSTDVLTIPMSHEEIAYELTFDPHGQVTTATIEDDIGPRKFGPNLLEAVILPVDAAGNTSPGEVLYNDDMVVREGNTILQVCTDIYDPVVTPPEDWEHCYLGDIGDGNIKLFKVNGVVTITYSARVETGLTEEICREGIICQEKYINAADARVTEVNEQNVNINVNSNQITVQIFCQYILTRAAGDIFLENDLSSGIDINICSQYRSSTGIIITPGDEETPDIVSTGASSEIFTVGHEVCTSGQAGTIENDLAELYGQEITGLSSQICEVKLRTGSPWKQKVITNTIDENKTRVSRWGADPTLPSNLSGIINTIGLGNSIYADQDVFHIAGDVQTGDIKMDEVGAKTFIVEDGDLYINGNIEYTGTCYEAGGCTVRDVASLAFIVLNGNIYVDKDVNEISGVFFVQEGDDGTGKIMSNEYPGTTETQSDVQLIVYGSIYGDIDPLFSQRFFTGDPSSDLGGIVIRFDQRVILNTPPGLRDVLNLSQTEVAR